MNLGEDDATVEIKKRKEKTKVLETMGLDDKETGLEEGEEGEKRKQCKGR